MKGKMIIFGALVLIPLIFGHAGCSQNSGDDTPFEITVSPTQLNGHSIAGQKIVFLVTIADEGGSSTSTVEISATAPGAEITILNGSITQGEVAEIMVTPSAASTGGSIQLTVKGTRGTITDEESLNFPVIEGMDDRQEYAGELMGKFVSWLEANHPELGISENTEWSGTTVSPEWLVVSHYLFFSDEWEAHISWHVMIAPYDWSKLDLRHRFDETAPSYAFEISSVSGGINPVPVEVPETIWR
ncbi:MAG: hypothetical protein PHY25_02800 [Dehalococcoidales bacterium]|jgi:hypothetical protein|nr:hypothetical protein [Limnochordia bacterium]MDD4465593.1 hypothetical protein [Dehalococcoidales bacterium]